MSTFLPPPLLKAVMSTLLNWESLMMIRLPLDDGAGTIHLLSQNQAHHLVGESHQ